MSEEKKDENPLVTVSSILTGENSKLPVKEKKEEEEELEREVDSDNAEQDQVRLKNKKNEEEKSEEKKYLIYMVNQKKWALSMTK